MADDKKAKKDDKPKDEKPKDDKPAKGTKEVEQKGTGGESTDGAAAAEGAEQQHSGFTPKKIVLFVVLPLLLIVGGGTGAYFMGFLDKILPHKAPNCENIKEGDKGFAECATMQDATAANHPGAFLNIPDMIVNLNSANSKQPRFLKVSLKLEIENPEDEKKLEPLLPRVVDQFQMYLRELRIEDLRGTSGIYRMKIELLSRVRAAVPNIKIRDVLFQEILVQ
ncbi:MAG: flagellar basal body-associated FliL family protein [Proteobacteria bacterium]|nr:flagellar basal body-associated FliL family protein [Pseudomonadota bacterium]